ncbi:hypothetical protein DNTS_015627, partial [Danionella cerebrum]
ASLIFISKDWFLPKYKQSKCIIRTLSAVLTALFLYLSPALSLASGRFFFVPTLIRPIRVHSCSNRPVLSSSHHLLPPSEEPPLTAPRL